MKTLYLYGAPGSGKTTLAKRLARETGRLYLDLDEVITAKIGCPISEFFARHGESAFRAVESAILREVDAPIIALGGGTLLADDNRAYCESRGLVAVLDVDRETIARRVAADGNTRPLGDKFEERRAHYASFPHRIDENTAVLLPRKLRGRIRVPPSKSCMHRQLIAAYLAGALTSEHKRAAAGICADIDATLRCLDALPNGPFDVGESGSTLRFLAPVFAALGVKAEFIRHGRLSERPFIPYDTLKSGVHELRGDISSQFVTGLLFALPLLEGDSEIRFTTPLESAGYVDLTLDVLAKAGIEIARTERGFAIRGSQRYHYNPEFDPATCEGDWSAAAFWFAANALGSAIEVEGLSATSVQPDHAVQSLLSRITAAASAESPTVIDISQSPDLYPALAVTAAAVAPGKVRFTGTERLRLKECDRLAAVEALLAHPEDVDACNDHRIAMAAAIFSTVQAGPVLVHGASAVAKSYPDFWQMLQLDLYAVTGWPLAKTNSPMLHNAAFAAMGARAEFVSMPCATIEAALENARRLDLRGLAVTIPHKQTVMAHLHRIEPEAQAIGAVNTVRFERNGETVGTNTDAAGFAAAISRYKFHRVALLGAGGAAKACLYALRKLGAEVEVFHRQTPVGHFDLIVNATPVDPIPDYVFRGDEIVYDLRYVPEITPLMARAAAAGCTVENGMSMLIEQARLQRLFWNVESKGEKQ